jgi:hypothetical protein
LRLKCSRKDSVKIGFGSPAIINIAKPGGTESCAHTRAAKSKSLGQHCVGKLWLYEILYNVNQGL